MTTSQRKEAFKARKEIMRALRRPRLGDIGMRSRPVAIGRALRIFFKAA